LEISGDSFWKHIAELERDMDVLQHAVDLNTEDHDFVLASNKNLASKHDQLNLRCESP
jgi:hypothetical protein